MTIPEKLDIRNTLGDEGGGRFGHKLDQRSMPAWWHEWAAVGKLSAVGRCYVPSQEE
jgi:hypothetical protein